MSTGPSLDAHAHGPLRRDWASISIEQFADLYHILCGYGSAGMPVAWTVMARWFECIARGDRIAAAAIRDEAWRRLRHPHDTPIRVEKLEHDLDALISTRRPPVGAKARAELDPLRCAFCGALAEISVTRLWPATQEGFGGARHTEFVETVVPYCGKC